MAISGSGVLALLSKNDDNKIVIDDFEFKNFSKNVILENQITSKEIFESELAEIVKNYNPTEIAFCLPATACFIQNIKLPQVDDNELESVALQEILRHLPFEKDEVKVNWQIIENNNQKEALMVATKKELLNSYISSIGKDKTTNAEICGFAAIRALADAGLLEDTEILTLTVIIGYESTEINIIKKGMPLFSYSANIGKKNILDTAEHFNLSHKQAEDILYNTSIFITPEETQDETELKLVNAVRSIFNNISNEIIKVIDFYTSQNKSENQINKLILTGEGICTQKLDEYISNKVKISTVIANPLKNLYFSKEAEEKLADIVDFSNFEKTENHMLSAQSFAACVGLALKG
ncbi:MAG: pilus assembly protein PilM [Candidatus Gastranaerophilales bacterium]|nr:pilus assembly protein PilM [Candidatus Gastranaerophilales bacterium]